MTLMSAASLTRADRQRLLEHLAEAGELDRLMRESGTLASPPEPPRVHRRGREEGSR
jgi:hypothetical protein